MIYRIYESFESKILYHGSPYNFDLPNKNNIFYLTDDKNIALEYIEGKYYVKTDKVYIYSYKIKSNAKVINLCDLSNKISKEVFNWINLKSKYKSNYGEYSEKDYVNKLSYAMIEYDINLIKFLKNKKVDVFIISDMTDRGIKHLSYVVLNLNSVELINKEIIDK